MDQKTIDLIESLRAQLLGVRVAIKSYQIGEVAGLNLDNLEAMFKNSVGQCGQWLNQHATYQVDATGRGQYKSKEIA